MWGLKEGCFILYTLYYILHTEKIRESAGMVYRLVSKTSGGNSMRVRVPPLPPFDKLRVDPGIDEELGYGREVYGERSRIQVPPLPPFEKLRVLSPYFLMAFLLNAIQRAIRRNTTIHTKTVTTSEIGGSGEVPAHPIHSSYDHSPA